MWHHKATSRNTDDVVEDVRFRGEAAGVRVQSGHWADECRVDRIPEIPDAGDVDESGQNSEGQVETPSLEDSGTPTPAPTEEKEKDLRTRLNCNPEFGINLAPLLVGLCADPSVIEKDEPWDYDAIFQQVTEDLLRESIEDNSQKGSGQQQAK
ncbi:hypothetical protein NCLIV_041670 [Neospora caninum Liverpool]|uniref:Uncharacterized protein n=1 Tax=Neospora caninum (strain Liverpool) TaxID=572307 RepID=F0VBV8_NEOCL|nr:hypothetical protein NCLIV_041670 [Neospora caninum Liverpool]CBZ51092.1 hypothetical protein NCLIV_041670 [Neospora caninum Liverpool]CEL68399.1 TPA: hypothetical protein BN1204_041670 [Neospora caninum Liverpool]|eukprot:XP_003881125.1 hypothetical protein NCLIV_041670 [Neospora caninum Liverpool]